MNKTISIGLQAEESTLTEADVNAIRLAEVALVKSMYTSDLTAWAWGELYSNEGVFVPSNGLTDRDREDLTNFIESFSTAVSFPLIPTEIEGRSDLAYVCDHYSWEFAAPDIAPMSATGRYLTVIASPVHASSCK